MTRTRGEFAAWLAGLENRRVDLVFVQRPWPIEDDWMRTDSARFRLDFEDAHVRAYRVNGL